MVLEQVRLQPPYALCQLGPWRLRLRGECLDKTQIETDLSVDVLKNDLGLRKLDKRDGRALLQGIYLPAQRFSIYDSLAGLTLQL